MPKWRTSAMAAVAALLFLGGWAWWGYTDRLERENRPMPPGHRLEVNANGMYRAVYDGPDGHWASAGVNDYGSNKVRAVEAAYAHDAMLRQEARAKSWRPVEQ